VYCLDGWVGGWGGEERVASLVLAILLLVILVKVVLVISLVKKGHIISAFSLLWQENRTANSNQKG